MKIILVANSGNDFFDISKNLNRVEVWTITDDALKKLSIEKNQDNENLFKTFNVYAYLEKRDIIRQEDLYEFIHSSKLPV